MTGWIDAILLWYYNIESDTSNHFVPVQGQIFLGLQTRFNQPLASLSWSSCNKGTRLSWTEVL